MKILKLILAGLLAVSALPAYAGFEDGVTAYQKQNYSTAFKEWKLLGDQGDARAQDCIGTMYLNGYGVKRDYTKAMQWYWMAAEQGYADAQDNIGVMYLNGYGVKRNYSEAMRWYRTAAEKGSSSAMVNIGMMYRDGSVGVAKDYAEAMRWYRKALETENVEGDFSIAQGVAWGQFSIGGMYEHGYGVDKDYAEALNWYRKAAERGLSFAQEYVGMMYDFPIGVQQNHSEAMKWYRKAAKQGVVSAQKRLREMEKAKLSTAQSSADAERVFSSDIHSEDGESKIHIGYELGGKQINSVAILLPEGYLFCDPRKWGSANSHNCPSDLFFRFSNSDTESRMTLAMPISQHTALLNEAGLHAFARMFDHVDKYALVVYNKHGDKFLVEFFKRNLIENHSVF
ncbi:tetratricopeptide repeat protein [Sideroxydans sp.]